jgi:hypothetical protein
VTSAQGASRIGRSLHWLSESQLVCLLEEENTTFASNQALTTTNIVLSCISLVVLTITGCIYITQLYKAARHDHGAYSM